MHMPARKHLQLMLAQDFLHWQPPPALAFLKNLELLARIRQNPVHVHNQSFHLQSISQLARPVSNLNRVHSSNLLIRVTRAIRGSLPGFPLLRVSKPMSRL